MTNGNSLINLGDLSKPATILIEKISNAVGILYEPKHIKDIAKAEVEADKIKALATIELGDIQQRAIDRLVKQETRKQENIEKITAQSLSSLTEDAKPEGIEDDWLSHFFTNCESVSDHEMQSLWSRLLSGEATNPGAFTKRTINYVASMDKGDAKLFTKICQFTWDIGNKNMQPLIFNSEHGIYKDNGIDFEALKHLDTIGLISFEPNSGYARFGLEKKEKFTYFDEPLILEFPKEKENELQTGQVLFTQAGKELEPICGAHENKEFKEYVTDIFRKQGFIPEKNSLNKK